MYGRSSAVIHTFPVSSCYSVLQINHQPVQGLTDADTQIHLTDATSFPECQNVCCVYLETLTTDSVCKALFRTECAPHEPQKTTAKPCQPLNFL